MRAAVLADAGCVVVDGVPVPGTGDDLVLVRVAFNGICGSDLALIRHRRTSSGPVPAEPEPGAQIVGHEFSGVVESVGAEVTDFKVGDRVVAQPNYSCGDCSACKRGLTNLCGSLAFHGIHNGGGGLCELTALPAANLHHIPDTMSLEQAAIVEPLAVAYRAVDRSAVDASSCVVILGAGPIGVCVALNVRAAGVRNVVVSDPSAGRRGVLENLGFAVLDPASEDVAGYVRSTMDAAGADAVFECSGTAVAFATAMSCIGPQGRTVLVGISEAPLELSVPVLLMSEGVVMTTLAYQRSDFEAVIRRSVEGAYPVDGWVEHAGLDDLPNVISELESASRMKVLIDLSSDAPAGGPA